MNEVNIGATDTFEDPGRRVVDISGVQVGIFQLDGQFYAYENLCPHLGGPACQGKMLPLALEGVRPDKTSEGRIFSKEHLNVVCPWHGFEFDIRTGEHPIKKRMRLRKVPVEVRDGFVYVRPPSRQAAE